MKPYYDRAGATIYLGDSRDVIPFLAAADVVITDPVWPNSIPSLKGHEDPAGLFTAAAHLFERLTTRLVVHLGCDSDPRFLAQLPSSFEFLRACWLEYVQPHHKGRILYSGDVAYAFGAPARAGYDLIPGMKRDTSNDGKQTCHPAPRKLAHLLWLVRWFSQPGETILDPFMGSGTTLRAAKNLGRKSIGIEIEEKWCELTARRLDQDVLL